jgi:hypothetical protein
MNSPRGAVIAAATLLVAFMAPIQMRPSYGEPYPALLMPRFDGGGVSIDEPVVVDHAAFSVEFSDGGSVTMWPRELLRSIPDSQHGAIMSHNFGPDRWAVAAATVSPHGSAGWLPGRALMWQRYFDTGRAFKAAPWLKEHLTMAFPHRTPTSVTVKWFRSETHKDGEIRRRVIHVGVINL